MLLSTAMLPRLILSFTFLQPTENNRFYFHFYCDLTFTFYVHNYLLPDQFTNWSGQGVLDTTLFDNICQ
jgi:hypothetical protein